MTQAKVGVALVQLAFAAVLLVPVSVALWVPGLVVPLLCTAAGLFVAGMALWLFG